MPNKFENEVIFYKVDVDVNTETPEKNNVEVYPTFLLFKNQKQVHKVQGADLESLTNAIKKHK